MHNINRIFLNYKKGEIFIVNNAIYYRRIGLLFFLNALLAKPIVGALHSVAATFANPVGQRFVSISFGTPNVYDIFCGILVMVISWVMLETSKINEDNRYTV